MNNMKRPIRLNMLDMNCMGCTPGIWSHPADETAGYHRLDYWIQTAKMLEEGLFDALFIADIFGVYDVYGGNADAGIRHAVEFPVNDPFLLVPAMAAATRHLGFGVTGTLTYEPPYSLARTLSTLDHLTEGRFAWNIVTGYLASAARAFGLTDQMTHDQRYDYGEEYMEVVYKLWEGSWEEGAVQRDKVSGIFADPRRVHPVIHQGKYFQMEGYHICEPSPQRTPVLFQAGASTRGKAFAARHAECVFVSGLTPAMAARTVKELRENTRREGRSPDDLVIFNGMTPILGQTDAEARERLEDYHAHVNIERVLTLFSGYTGIDFSGWDLDAPLEYFESNSIQSFVEGFTCADPERTWTLREIALFMGVGGFAPIEVGSPETIADRLEHWMDTADLDGFNLIYAVAPQDIRDFIRWVVPILQERGRYPSGYTEGTLREKLFGPGRRLLPSTHPAARFRK